MFILFFSQRRKQFATTFKVKHSPENMQALTALTLAAYIETALHFPDSIRKCLKSPLKHSLGTPGVLSNRAKDIMRQ